MMFSEIYNSLISILGHFRVEKTECIVPCVYLKYYIGVSLLFGVEFNLQAYSVKSSAIYNPVFERER